MIAKLTGKVDSQQDTSLVIDVNGVGYALLCSRTTLKDLPPRGQVCSVFVEPIIRSEQITLFGFFTEQERSIFRLLLTVQGVGGKVCISLLSSMTPSQIQNSILSQDAVPLTQADGVGPKVAQRIVRELKDKVGAGVFASEAPSFVESLTSQVQREAISALTNLGYKKQEVLEAVHKVTQESTEDLSLNQVVPLVLKQLTSA
ncbi:Holliday junction branch migration protein RuvA [Alphaproteobacteria bacterium]|nr:Holliday junction branch migration protein RuvA [Alphaproteobacteria bacterium]